MSESQKTLLLLKPRGFCAGVVRAIDIVRIALEAFGPPIYVRKEIVHNRFVVEELQGKGDVLNPEQAFVEVLLLAVERLQHLAAQVVDVAPEEEP